mmetsp:Transcript_130393/g.243960  ORF Transcript_130393/g.243960 Transcript_130393/m.243960 type:complete len:89 (-) Transcript_130393:2-268(-)
MANPGSVVLPLLEVGRLADCLQEKEAARSGKQLSEHYDGSWETGNFRAELAYSTRARQWQLLQPGSRNAAQGRSTVGGLAALLQLEHT